MALPECESIQMKSRSRKRDVFMQPRMSNPATLLPDATKGIQYLLVAARKGGVPQAVLDLVHLRASQINGCSFCVGSAGNALKAGESPERLFAVAAWRDAPYFTDAERAALALDPCRHPPCRPARPGPRRDLGRGRPALRRAGTRGFDPHDRHDQPLQPPQRHHQAVGRQPELVAPDPRGERNGSG